MPKRRATKAKLLNNLYYKPDRTGSYGGINRLWSAVKLSHNAKNIKYNDVTSFLTTQPVYTLHKPSRTKYPRNRTKVNVPGFIVQMDTWVLTRLSDWNDGYK